MMRKIEDSVIVVTGASSGIGRATARAFARKGGTVVLAARREEALGHVEEECRDAGGRGLAVPTDVSDEQAVQKLARCAIEELGRIDVWVNNAAVSLFARFEEAPPEVYRRVFETNLFGYIHGARAVMPYFREQSSGVLINVSSVVSSAPQPYTSAYVATKYAIQGWSECLRMELALEDTDIHVCTVRPASIDTPIFQQAANYIGRAAKAMDPTYSPELVADAIVDMAERPQKRDAVVGSAGRLMTLPHTLAPALHERMAARQVDKNHFQDQPAAPTQGNLFEPMPEEARVSGGWQSDGKRRKVPAVLAALAAGGAAAYALSRGRKE